MNEVGVVVISVLAGMFLLVLVAGLGYLVWIALDIRKSLVAINAEKSSVYAETGKFLAELRADLKSQVEAGRSSFSGIRTEMKTLMEEHRGKTCSLLEDHRKETGAMIVASEKAMQVGIDKINAEALAGAAGRTLQACLRLEKVATILQQMMIDTEGRATHDYAPEEFAPETAFGTPPSSYNQSTTAALDEQVEQEVVTQASELI